MASLLLPLPLPTRSLLSPQPLLNPNPIKLSRPHRRSISSRKSRGVFVKSAAIDEAAAFDPVASFREVATIPSLKLKLLSAISGLNRGLAANEEDLQKADSAAKELEAAGGAIDLAKDLEKLQGKWKLLYSSAFSSRTLGGSRPGPPIGRLLPITLGQVFQRIDTVSKDFDNIVELQFGTPWPLPPLEATASLAHKFEIIGNASIRIKFTKTTVKPTGEFSQIPLFEVPQLPENLRPSSRSGNGEFDVTFLDSDTRITRGDKGELRVFVIA